MPIVNAGAITERNGAMVIVLSIFTCGVYYLFWCYNTTSELKAALADEELKPGLDILLIVVTCTLWSVYAQYRNAQKVHAALLSRDPYAKDQSDMVLGLHLAGLLVGATGLIAVYILQEELNRLARMNGAPELRA
jgi:hypothetical protein